jgi:uncharacterized alpha/beta hydrolase family protein
MRIIKKTIVLIAVLVVGLFSCFSVFDENKSPVTEPNTQQPNEVKKIPALQ